MNARKKRRVRLYKGEDSRLLQKARTKRVHFIANLSAFTDFDPSLNSAYADAWLAQIEECENHPTDKTMGYEVQERTDNVVKARKKSFNAVNGLKFYVKRAFPGDDEILDEFGFNERKTMHYGSYKIVLWLTVMKELADEYSTELAAADMPASVISDIELAAQNQEQKEIEQAYCKKLRIRYTRQRFSKFNLLYKTCTTVRNAAKLVFVNDKERKRLFAL